MKSSEDLKKQMSNYYNQSHDYIQIMQEHDEEYFATYLALIARFITPLGSGSADKILDLGCGSGLSTASISKRFPGYQYIGSDISISEIVHASQHNSHDNLFYLPSDCTALPFKDNAFTLVGSCDCIEHVPDTESFLNEMIRVTKPGGLIVIKAPHLRNPIIPIIDMLSFTHRYPFTHKWIDNFPRFLELSFSFIKKALDKEVSFNTRTPDLTDSTLVGSDADVVYEVSVLDLIQFFKNSGLSLLNIAASRNNTVLSTCYTKLFPFFASIGIVARKE